MSISVIMSVYNESLFINDSISSILNQNFKNFEFLIIDDASDDNTRVIIRKIMEVDKRIILYENKTRQGLTKNLNFLIQSSKFDVIARMDADDISHPDRLGTQYKFLETALDLAQRTALRPSLDDLSYDKQDGPLKYIIYELIARGCARKLFNFAQKVRKQVDEKSWKAKGIEKKFIKKMNYIGVSNPKNLLSYARSFAHLLNIKAINELPIIKYNLSTVHLSF